MSLKLDEYHEERVKIYGVVIKKLEGGFHINIREEWSRVK